MTKTRLQASTVVLDVTSRGCGNIRKGSLAEIVVDADKQSLRLSKEWIRSENFTRARLVNINLRKTLESYALPSCPFKSGTYMIPIRCLEEITPILEKAQTDYEEAADALEEEWDEIIVDARLRLRSQFVPENYPSAAAIRAKYSMSWRLLEFSVPDSSTIGEELYKQELAKAQNVWAEAEQEVTLALREGLHSLVNRLASQLEVKTDGSKGKITTAAVRDINEFLDMFANRNVLGDDELKELVEKAKGIMDGKSMDDVKKDKLSLAADLKEISAGLDTLITTSKRKFDFSE